MMQNLFRFGKKFHWLVLPFTILGFLGITNWFISPQYTISILDSIVRIGDAVVLQWPFKLLELLPIEFNISPSDRYITIVGLGYQIPAAIPYVLEDLRRRTLFSILLGIFMIVMSIVYAAFIIAALLFDFTEFPRIVVAFLLLTALAGLYGLGRTRIVNITLTSLVFVLTVHAIQHWPGPAQKYAIDVEKALSSFADRVAPEES